jgi:Dolichyl-phosphate-mannose-protein mannosyltransferase
MLVALYLLLTYWTMAWYMGDTADYVDSILVHEAGQDYHFWEFGHLVWSPLGWVVYRAIHPIAALFYSEPRLQATSALILLSWTAGLTTVLLLFATARRFATRTWPAVASASLLLFSHAFLNYSQTASSYVPGLAFLMLAFYLLLVPAGCPHMRWWIPWLAGSALAGAVLLWFTYLFAVPAALLAPFLLPADRPRARLVATACLSCVVFIGAAYASVLIHLRIFDVAGLRHWISSSGHGIQFGGVARMVFGLGGSFFYMGNDAMLVKRFLRHDPFNPVALDSLLRLSLWKLPLFYATTVSSLLALFRGRNTAMPLLLAVNAVPVLAFASFWNGAAIERYFPLYGTFFLAVAISLDAVKPRWHRILVLVFVATLAITNINALSRRNQVKQQAVSVDRIGELLPVMKPRSRIVLSHWQDELINFNRAFPFHPINRGPLRLYALWNLNTESMKTWKRDFASTALSTWDSGSDVWVSKRVLQQRPKASWYWVEGDDGSVSWRDLPRFFAPWDRGNGIGGEDGFFLLPDSDDNRELATRLAGTR